jgi:UDP-glucosyltransferase BX8/BX9
VLHSRGFAVTVFHTRFNAPDPVRHPRYRFVPVPDGTPGPASSAIEDVVAPSWRSTRGTPSRAWSPTRTSCQWSRWPVGSACQRWRCAPAAPPASRASSRTPCSARKATSPCKTVRVPVSSYFASVLVLYVSSSCVRASLRFLDQRTRVNLILWMQTRSSTCRRAARVRDLMSFREEGHALAREMQARAVAAVMASSGLILNTFAALKDRDLAGLRRALAVPVLDVGPLHKFFPAAASESSQDTSRLAWLEEWPPNAVLYVSFGSLACMSERDLVETAWGVAGSGVPFLWVLRPGLVRGGEGDATNLLPEGFEAATRGRGRTVAWAPQEGATAPSAGSGRTTAGTRPSRVSARACPCCAARASVTSVGTPGTWSACGGWGSSSAVSLRGAALRPPSGGS